MTLETGPTKLSSSRCFTATRNACKLCAPLGACLAFRGVAGAIAFLHGSQGCSTYIRRYMISHFREPIDIACTNFDESAAIFGGQRNLRTGLANVVQQYHPELIGIATTCLAETIGEDVPRMLSEIRRELSAVELPPLVPVSTPSYAGTHGEGYHATVRALVDVLVPPASGPCGQHVGLMPGMVSPADLRYLRELACAFGLDTILLPDYSDTLDGPAWSEYQRIPPGGTPVAQIQRLGTAQAAIELGSTCHRGPTAGALLKQRCGVPHYPLPLPIGVRASDRLVQLLETCSGRPLPESHAAERGRLIDALVDAHKYVFGRRIALYGEPDLVLALAGMLAEIGAVPALCATGADTGNLRQRIGELAPQCLGEAVVLEGVDFLDIEEQCGELAIELVVGNSKGFKLAKSLNVPLVRIGFPIHDRIGGARLMHVGYRGTQQLFDRIANALIGKSQDDSEVGYTYM
jgi:nitrogenase molybdenum-iron protein NifN